MSCRTYGETEGHRFTYDQLYEMETVKMKKGNYNCFSYNQMIFLVKAGIEPIHEMKHKDTEKTFWVFKNTQVLGIMLRKWSENKYRQTRT